MYVINTLFTSQNITVCLVRTRHWIVNVEASVIALDPAVVIRSGRRRREGLPRQPFPRL
jgi:hypothetical protein